MKRQEINNVLESQACTNGYRWDYRLSPDAEKTFKRCVREGTAARVKALWPYFTHGTVWKTCYISLVPRTDDEPHWHQWIPDIVAYCATA